VALEIRPPAPPGQLDKWADEIMADPVFHPQAAFADGRIVGGSAMLSLEITVPGPRLAALGGVTSTAVIATHRRRADQAAPRRRGRRAVPAAAHRPGAV
jgi:hypothetical protein